MFIGSFSFWVCCAGSGASVVVTDVCCGGSVELEPPLSNVAGNLAAYSVVHFIAAEHSLSCVARSYTSEDCVSIKCRIVVAALRKTSSVASDDLNAVMNEALNSFGGGP